MAIRIPVNEGANWIDIQETEPGVFEIVDDDMTVKNGDWVVDDTTLGASPLDDEVEDLDKGSSDLAQCFNGTEMMRWQDVTIDLMSGNKILAPSVERIHEAVKHIGFSAWCAGDI